MPWARFECDFWQDAKVLALTDGAFRLYVSGISWSAGHLTDGVIPCHVVATLVPRKRRNAANKLAEELTEIGLWEGQGPAFRIRRYERYQPTKAQVERDREVARERMRRLRSPEQGGDVRANDARSSPTHPTPPHTDTEPPSEVQRVIPKRSAEHRGIARAGAARFVELYVDECRAAGAEPVPRDKARIGREARELLEAGKPDELIAEAVRQTARNGKTPGALVRVVGDLERARAGHPHRAGAEPKSWSAIRNVLGREP